MCVSGGKIDTLLVILLHMLPWDGQKNNPSPLSNTLDLFYRSKLGMDAITGIQGLWALARRSLYLLLPMTYVQMHSQNTSAHLSFHHANTIAVELSVIVEREGTDIIQPRMLAAIFFLYLAMHLWSDFLPRCSMTWKLPGHG